MDYYERKRRVYLTIKRMAEGGTTIDDIKFAVIEQYQVGEKVILDYYNMLESRGFVNEPKRKGKKK